MTLFAIDPGNMESGWVVCEYDDSGIKRIIDKGKDENKKVLTLLHQYAPYELAIEMIASYGMAVGAEVFDTCVWIGRFRQAADKLATRIEYVFRKEEKLCLCQSMKANDANIRQALVDRYTPGMPNYGKGTKKQPGLFYGFSADAWAAMAVATTYHDKYIKGVQF